MPIPIYTVDAFTSVPFAGNPAAICLLDRERDDTWLQALAAEMNLSETAYVLLRADGWGLRWFTPRVEVDLCGHATLATAHLLWEIGKLQRDQPAVFWTRSGKLTCRRVGEQIAMDFPAEPAVAAEPSAELLRGLGKRPTFTGWNRMDCLAMFDSEEIVKQMIPDQTELAKLPARGIIVTARSSGDYDFVSRAFFPSCGVPEDPVCGSAHCCLGPFWRERLGKDVLVGHQISQRGGVVHVKCAGDRVILSGNAITVMRGELLV